VYSRRIAGQTYRFGVSGLLYNSNVLMYDRQTESLWSQILRQAVTGPLAGTRLETLPSTMTTWKQWQKKYPQSEVLSLNTGYRRNYDRDPYEDYYRSRSGLFGFLKSGPGEEDKELVVGIEAGGEAVAYPLAQLRRVQRIETKLAGKELALRFRVEDDRITATLGDEEVPHLVTYWFVWKSFYPETERFGGKSR